MRHRHRVGWSDLADAPVGVWGAGVEGQAAVRRLVGMGVDPVVVDDRPSDPRTLPTDAGGLEALERCAFVVKSPGIPGTRREIAYLERIGVRVVGGLALWLEEADLGRVVCITGTKGKSTTASVAGHLLTGLGERCLVGGNLGLPPFDPDVPDDYDWWILEVSSYQAADVASSPPVVAVTSLSADHLGWHGGLEAYIADKLSLCSQPGADLTIANGDDPLLRARPELLGPRVEWVSASPSPPEWVGELGLLGRHNELNALIAQRCLAALGVPGADDGKRLVEGARGFPGLDSRLRPLGTVDGVDFVDDSLSTNVLPTLAAVDVFEGRAVALLAGGLDRDIDYAPLAQRLVARDEPTLLLALPTSGERIAAAVDAQSDRGHLEVLRCTADGEDRTWFSDAVMHAFEWARERGGVVLLSPAAASFDHFTDYRDRAAAFAAAMRRCA
jgi:UDP-N-acetylmuramoyl-L-alanine---L-glutamate ligase